MAEFDDDITERIRKQKEFAASTAAGKTVKQWKEDRQYVQDIADIFGGPFEYKPKRLEPFQTLADNTKARDLLGWKPTGNVEEWLGNYINENLRDDTN